MIRKIIKQGHNTLTVTLPAEWVRGKGLKGGDEIDLSIIDGEILVSAENKDTIKKAEINVKKPNRLISRSIFNLYRKGVDEIKINYDDPIIIRDIYGYMPLLMGFEITEQGKNYSIIKNVMKINPDEFNSTMRRYFLITKSLADETYLALKENRFDDMKGLIELESVQNRLYMYLCRVIHKNSIVKNPTLLFLLIQRLEDIADDYKYICQYVTDLGGQIKISKPVLDMIKDTNKVLDLVYHFYYKFDNNTGKEIIESKKKIIKNGLKLLETVNKKEIRIIHIINGTIVKIYEAAAPIFGMSL
jgi:phosphate uptake regulator